MAQFDREIITEIEDTEYDLQFKMNGVDVSLANALRRTILSDIPTVIFRTTPPEKNDCTIYKNTSILNNEIIKQRLSCIPIHELYKQELSVLKNLILEVNVDNNTNEYLIVTTRDFKIKQKDTGEYLPESEVKKIFPPSKIVWDTLKIESYTDFVKLRPKIADLPGDVIRLSCDFSYGTANEDGMYNVVSTCSYGNIKDEELVIENYNAKKRELESKGLTQEDMDFELKDWLLLDSFRYFYPNRFNFIIETLGVYTNKHILQMACDTIVEKLFQIQSYTHIIPSVSTLENEYEVWLLGEDYTIGKLVENSLYQSYMVNSGLLKYCGFRKTHPHEPNVLIRLSFVDPIPEDYNTYIIELIKTSITNQIEQLDKIKNSF
jgi:DNA-directed RNA polymerase subunit L